jgi:hypothetical protein
LNIIISYSKLQNEKFGTSGEIGKLLKPVQTLSDGIDIVKNSSKAHAFISSREHLTYSIIEKGREYFYLPPQTEESTFNLDTMGIAMQKEFKYKREFNKLYVNYSFLKKFSKAFNISFQYFYYKKRRFSRLLEDNRI